MQPSEGNPLAESLPRCGASPATESMQPDLETLPPMPTPVWRTLIVQRVFGVSYVLVISGGLVSATLVPAAPQLCHGGRQCTHILPMLSASLYSHPHCSGSLRHYTALRCTVALTALHCRRHCTHIFTVLSASLHCRPHCTHIPTALTAHLWRQVPYLMLDNVPEAYSLTALAMIAICVSVALGGLVGMVCGNPGVQEPYSQCAVSTQ